MKLRFLIRTRVATDGVHVTEKVLQYLNVVGRGFEGEGDFWQDVPTVIEKPYETPKPKKKRGVRRA